MGSGSKVLLFPPLSGLQIVENPYLVIRTRAKTHRKKRIDKKWRKRYGFITRPDSRVYKVGDTIYAHPHVAQIIRNEIQKGRIV